MSNGDGTTAVHVVIHGRVQGVWFRGWTVERAEALELRGWVRNRSDGSVEAMFIGPQAAVREMIRICGEGPPQALVSRVDEGRAEDDGSEGFRQRPTEQGANGT